MPEARIDALLERIDRLTEIGTALSAERDMPKLLERILFGAMRLTHADGGTLYRLQDDRLHFEILSNVSLGIQMGGSSGDAMAFEPIPLHDDAGRPNHSMVVSHCVLTGHSVNIEDAYRAEGFDFSGTRDFDRRTGYRTRSILTFPLKNHEREIIGVLQLINARAGDGDRVLPFGEVDQRLAESLASMAAVALTQQQLLNDLQNLFESFIRMIASAIDDKSPYTGSHCRRIPVLTMMLAEAAHRFDEGPLRDFRIDDEDRYELETAAWLHDCGKVVTPEHVMDKATKLETIHDRIELVESRFEILLRDRELDCLKAIADGGDAAELRRAWARQRRSLEQDLEFLRRINAGGEYMEDAAVDRVRRIAGYRWRDRHGGEQPLLTDDEVRNLCVRKGTLNDEERAVINHHIVATINMLEALPFPKHLARVPEYAGGHHEKMDGSGYPRGLTREQMPVQARIMAIADIFEALTASDRPYKPGKKLSECLRIMHAMKRDRHIDPDLFDIFLKERVYEQYAREFLPAAQIDEISPQQLQAWLG